MSKPIIAVTMRIHGKQYVVNQDYIDAFQEAGAICLLLVPQGKKELEILLDGVDGICIPGGMDVDPSRYNQSNRQSDPIESEIDQLDLDVLDIAKEREIPVFGICRGLQIINVAWGGTLIQDLPKDLIDHTFSSKNNQRDKGHPIQIETVGTLFLLFGHETEVNTYHHQGIDRLGEGLKVVARAPDGMIEAIEAPNVIAVQWHPERMAEHRLFEYFVNMCRKNG